MPKQKMPGAQRKQGRSPGRQFEISKELKPYSETDAQWETSQPLGEEESNQQVVDQAKQRQLQRQQQQRKSIEEP